MVDVVGIVATGGRGPMLGWALGNDLNKLCSAAHQACLGLHLKVAADTLKWGKQAPRGSLHVTSEVRGRLLLLS